MKTLNYLIIAIMLAGVLVLDGCADLTPARRATLGGVPFDAAPNTVHHK